MGDDASVLDRELLQEKNIIAIRETKARMSEEKCLLREFIVNVLNETNNQRSVNCASLSRVTGPWQSHVRSSKTTYV